jgi:hypothetical protein
VCSGLDVLKHAAIFYYEKCILHQLRARREQRQGVCRVGVGHDPENQEEEGAFSLNVMAPASAPDAESDDDYSDPDIPDNDRLEVVGH